MKKKIVCVFLSLFTILLTQAAAAPFEEYRAPKKQSNIFARLHDKETVRFKIIDDLHPGEPEEDFVPYIQSAMSAWFKNILSRLDENSPQTEPLAPLMETIRFGAEPTHYQPADGQKADITFRFTTPEGVAKRCCPRGDCSGCASPELYLIYLDHPKNFKNLTRTVVHEIGHILNLDDQYIGMKNGKKYRSVFNESIMNNRSTLGCDDADGMVYMLWDIFGDGTPLRIASFCDEQVVYKGGYEEKQRIVSKLSTDIEAMNFYANCPGGPVQLLATVHWGNFDRLVSSGRNIPACLRDLKPTPQPAYEEIKADEDTPAHFKMLLPPQTRVFRKELVPQTMQLWVHTGEVVPLYAYLLNTSAPEPTVQFLFARLPQGYDFVYILGDDNAGFLFMAPADGKDIQPTDEEKKSRD